VFIVAAATLALSAVVIWRTVHGRSSEASSYVGHWKFISGEVTAGPNFHLGGKDKLGKPLADRTAFVEERDGTLWYSDGDSSCRYELHVAGGKAEFVSGSRTECDSKDPGANPEATTVRMSMTIDSEGQAHISGAARGSMEIKKGQRQDIEFTYDGIAVREQPSGK
jgi:hypothetical protein